MVSKIYDIVLEDHRVKVREIVKKVNFLNERVFNILHEYLATKKLSARRMPQLLTVDQKRTPVTMSKQCLEKFERNFSKFLR